MAYCDSVTDVYLQQIRETMFTQANDFDAISDKSYLTRQRLINRIQLQIDEKDRRLNMVTLLASSAGGVTGSLLSSAIHFLEGGPFLKDFTSP